VLARRTATVARVLEAIDGAGLAHIAAHGVFRADSPMFSSLRLADGPLTVHDLERLRRAPFRLILPSCDSGRLAPAGADELLGPARDRLGDGPVAIVPPGRLNAVPWALLPSLRDRAVTVAPSARTWIRAATARPFGTHRTVLVSGPGLGAARAEVRTLAAEYGEATVLGVPNERFFPAMGAA